MELNDIENAAVVTCFTSEEYITACGLAPNGRTVVAGEWFGLVHILALVGLDDQDTDR